MPTILRDYQLETIYAIKQAFDRGYSRPLNILFTGAGKTEIFIAFVMREINISNERVMINAPAHLVWQMHSRFMLRYPDLQRATLVQGINEVPSIGVVLGETNVSNARIICSSSDTIIDRVPTDLVPITREDFIVNAVGGVEKSPTSQRNVLVSSRIDDILKHGLLTYIMNDEAHHSVAPATLMVHNRLFEIYDTLGVARPKVIGFTATGMREDGVGLDNLYDCIAIQKPVNWGIANGYLAPPKPPVNIHPQIKGANIGLFELSNWEEVIITAWKEKGEDRPTLGYFPTIEASKSITEAFNVAGIPAVHIDGTGCYSADGFHHKDMREKFYQMFSEGKLKILCNFGVMVEGVDIPAASCIMWARETENITVFTQALGRILRLFDGNSFLPAKTDALVLNATRNDLFMLTVGTLSGITVNKDVEVEFEDDETEVETELPLIQIEDIRDVKLSDAVTYSVGRIIKKSGSDWAHSDDDVMTLSVSKNDVLVILPPYFTLAKRLEAILDNLNSQLVVHNFDQSLVDKYASIDKAYRLFSNYTLWHVKNGKVQGDWVYEDLSLSLLMDYAIPYAHEKADTVVSTFVSRKRTGWKDEKVLINEKQMALLESFIGKGKVDPKMTKLDASQLISYHIGFVRAVRPAVTNIFNQIRSVV